MFSARSIRRASSGFGSRRPASKWLMSVGEQTTCSASASCVSPAAMRRSFSSSPYFSRAVRGLPFAFIRTQLLDLTGVLSCPTPWKLATFDLTL
ncbi:hypothetical protein RB201_13165 [Streptomyces sp. S1A(2023)]